MKNLIMGAAKGYDWNTLEPFVLSWKKNCSSADLILFVEDISDFTRDKLIREGVIVKNFPDEMKAGIPNNTRWKIFADFLEIHDDNYEQVFITDTRDVIFQGDVFEKYKAYRNWLGYVTEADDIRGSKLGNRCNYEWLKNFFGVAQADKFLNKKIICSGTVIGTANEMKIFCHELWNILQKDTSFIADQAVMNYLVYENLLPIDNLIESNVERGEIFTIALTDNFSVYGDKIFRNGDVPAVVHQYDRHLSLFLFTNKIYREQNFQFDRRFNDARSVLDQISSLLHRDRLDEAAQIFIKKSCSTDDFSHHGGDLMKLWKNTLKKPPSKQLEVLELAIQYATILNKDFQAYPLNEIRSDLNLAKKNGHPIAPEFKIYIANKTLELAKENLESNNAENVFWCINAIEELEMPPDKNFYLFVAEANRIFGRKDEALAAYKKVLELS